MDLNFLKGMTLDDLLKVDLTQLKEDEVAYVEKRLVKAVNRRLNVLRKEGLISEAKLTAKEKKGISTYSPPKSRTRVTRGGKVVSINVRNKRIKSANKARDILLKETSRASGITKREEIYRKVISDRLGKEIKLDRRRLKRVGKLMKKAEELIGMGGINAQFSGSPIVLQAIIDIVKSRKYLKNDEAELIIKKAIENGYKSAQTMMNQLLNEDEDGTTIDFPIDE